MNALESPVAAGSQAPNHSPRTVFRPARATAANRTFMLQDAEKGVLIRVGEEFSLDVSEPAWHFRVRDETLLASDGAGNFQALDAGKTRVYATRAPSENDAGPPGSRTKLFVEIPVTVLRK